MKELLSGRDVAAAAGIARGSLSRMVQAGKLQALGRLRNGGFVFEASTIDADAIRAQIPQRHKAATPPPEPPR